MTGRNFSRFGFEWLPNLPGFVRARDGDYVKEEHPPVVLPATDPPPPEKNGLPLSEITMAEVLKAQGYHNGIVGKWHLGTSPVLAPTQRGFGEFVDFPGGAAMFAKADDPTVKTVLLPWSGIDGYLYANLTTNIWRDGKPVPAKKYMTEELGDEAVGFIDRNKAKPFFMQWPAKVMPGTILPGVASSLDFFPTFVAAAGGTMPADREYDGMNILPALTGEAPDSLLNRTFYWRKEDYRAIRHGDWKRQTAKYPDRVWLFDLATDPAEHFSVAGKFPEKVKELQTIYATQEAKYLPPAWAATARSRIDIDGYLEGAGDDVEHIYWAN